MLTSINSQRQPGATVVVDRYRRVRKFEIPAEMGTKIYNKSIIIGKFTRLITSGNGQPSPTGSNLANV